MLDQRVGTPTLQKWVAKFLGYNFVIKYKKDKENRETYALLRQFEENEVTLTVISLPTIT